MIDLQLLRIPIKEGKADRLREWISGLMQRRDEVLEALDAEAIRDEAVFLSEENGVHVVYIYSRADDLAASAAAFAASQLPVDVEFRALMQECLDFSCARPVPCLFAADAAARHAYAFDIQFDNEVEAGARAKIAQ